MIGRHGEPGPCEPRKCKAQVLPWHHTGTERKHLWFETLGPVASRSPGLALSLPSRPLIPGVPH